MSKSEPNRTLELEQVSQPEETPPLPEGETDTSGEEYEGPEKNEEMGGEADQKVAPQPRRDGFKAILFDILETILLTIVIYAVLTTFIGRFKVLSISMEPTLHEGQYLLISKQTHKIWPLKRGDVVVFHYPRNPQKNYIKRVIGLPGEKIAFRNGELYVNGEFTPEPWLPKPMRAVSGQWQLSEDEYFVMGDNRSNSSDSRSWGPVSEQHVIGKALLCYWPLEHWGLTEHGPEPTLTPVTSLESPLISPLPTGTAP